MSDKVSVITPSLNQESYIEQTIDSVLSQGYKNLEYIIIDGGSTDGSVNIIKKYERHLSYWVSEKDRGQSHAINKGLERATGDILAYLNSDDYYLPGAFEQVVDLYRSHPQAGLLHGRCRYVNEVGEIIGSQFGSFDSVGELLDLWGVWWNKRQVIQPEVFWTRPVYAMIGKFREDLYYVMDYDYWLRALLAGFRIARIDQEFTAFRFQPNQKTTNRDAVADDLRSVVRQLLWDPHTPLGKAERIRLQGQWHYDATFLAGVKLSIEQEESKIRRWFRLLKLVACHPQLLSSAGLLDRLRNTLSPTLK